MRIVLLAAVAFAVPRVAYAQSTCNLVGVWELVSGKADGQPYPGAQRMVKFVTQTRWAWVTGDSAPKGPEAIPDSLRALRSTGGSGTYTVQGSTYTETIELFPDLAYIGISIPFTCRVDGNVFYQSGDLPILEGGKPVRTVRLEEVYRRLRVGVATPALNLAAVARVPRTRSDRHHSVLETWTCVIIG